MRSLEEYMSMAYKMEIRPDSSPTSMIYAIARASRRDGVSVKQFCMDALSRAVSEQIRQSAKRIDISSCAPLDDHIQYFEYDIDKMIGRQYPSYRKFTMSDRSGEVC